jgi:molybdate transport system regulatory protein
LAKPPSIRFRIDFENDCNLGPGKIALLKHIDETGSLSAAARALAMSYRRAWLLLASVNDSFDQSVTVNTTGGAGGGGAKLTGFGHLLIERYGQLDDRIKSAGADCLKDILPHLAKPSFTAGKKLKRTRRSLAVRSRRTS